jgi:2-keto-4-pentenoate hydratase/2-oxohepta-3-ene-1,7-dioic acid hydratase in catechol pathway
MKLCTFRLPGESAEDSRIGLVTVDGIFETNKRFSMKELLDAGPRSWQGLGTRGRPMRMEKAILEAPLPRPRKILAAIVNTRGMLGGSDVSLERPRIDMKAPSAVIGPNQQIRGKGAGVRPEIELAAIMGKRISEANPEQAKAAIFGYTVLNDVTAPRDSREDAYEAYRRNPDSGELRKVTLRGPLFRSKNHDTFCPMGPWVVTSDELTDTSNLRMTTKFRGRLVQEGNTAEYIFTPERIASYISSFLTLEPGDVVSCGSVGWTPQALGDRDPTEFVCKPANGPLELTIEGVGTLVNELADRA